MTGFADALKKLTDKAKGDLEAAARQAMFLGAQGVVMKSPVDTGRFRGNWQFGQGAPNTATTAATDKSGASTLGAIKSRIDAAELGGVWYVTNSLPYAKRLEYGWSKQAPAGFVRLTAQELPDAIRDYVRGAL